MNLKLIAAFLGLIAWNNLYGQMDLEKLRGSYLGQKPPGMQPEIFAPGIISTKFYEHSAPAFSPDGNTVLWTVLYRQPKPATMLEMRMENGQWTMPAPPSFADSTADDFYPSFAPDGKKLYFSSRRRIAAGSPVSNTIRLWVVEKTAMGWGEAMLVDSAIFQPELYSHSITSSGTIYSSRRGQGGGLFDIEVYRRNDAQYLKPVPMAYNINSRSYEDGAFIAPDESYLIFESGRTGGIEGSIDLYISFRKSDGSWSIAKNMGPNVNSKFTERFARVSPDGKYLFFGSDRDPSPGAEGTDVYWVDAGVIDALKKQMLRENENPVDKEGAGIMPAHYRNDHTKVVRLLKEWLRVHPADIMADVDLIHSLRKSRQYAEAEIQINRLRKKLPDDNDLKAELALIKYGLNKNGDAEKAVAGIPATTANWRRFEALATELYGWKKFKESAAVYEIAVKIFERGLDFYNMACSYALAGDKEKSLNALVKAVDLGYNSRSQYENDPDLDSLKTDERFKKLLLRLI